MKYPLVNGKGGVIQGDQEIAKRCYVEGLMLKRIRTQGGKSKRTSSGLTPLEEVLEGEETFSPTSEGFEG